ncbi:hypothetical protein M3A49_00975 [Paraburkholderia sp. CNPSo 3076]|uniref:hypothetical protein n=1 Tax=Paraburkholderia sp. CNPSo 3076 TaxID=2940936 RepID=UPI002250F9D9|nr:hypothetical protein [Paraburkholderia sp. CNPSo 3076]MCX5538084.1 hypothetical protein [Paraburkholderia sp. CNPSo 3076]
MKAVEAVLNGTHWLTSPPLVQSWQTEGRVFAIERAGQNLYPRYIFDELGNPIAEVAEVLKVFEGHKPFRIASWFESANSLLRGRRPREVPATNAAAVVDAAKDHVVGPVHG